MPRQSLRERAARKTRKPSELIGARTDAITQMNSNLQRQFNKLEKSVNDLRAENLRYYYKIGKLCETIRESPEMYVGKDGTPGLKLVEIALSTQARTLRKAAMFARTYDEDQLNSLIGLTNPDTKFQLHWGHVSFLLTVPTDEKRARYAQEAVEKMLDPAALHNVIKKRTQRSGGHGRKHEMPKTISAQIRQVLTISRAWTGKNEAVWNGEEESVFGNIMNMPVDEMEPDMVDQLKEIKELMETIAESATSNVESTNRAIEHMEAAIAKREEEAATHAATGRQSRSINLDSAEGSPRRRRGTAATA